MKTKSITYIATVLLLAAMAAVSCNKDDMTQDPGKEETGGKSAGENQEETLLLLLAKNGYTVYSYSLLSTGHKFTFHKPKIIESIKDKYPQGVGELTVPASIVSDVDENSGQYTVSFKSGKKAVLNRYTEFRTTLAAHKDTTVYKGVAFTVPFKVTASNGNTLEVISKSSNGAGVEVSLEGTTGGTITVTPVADKGSVSVTLSNGILEVESEIAFDTYYITVTGVPEAFGDGNEFSFSLNLNTNLHEEEIIVESDSWIETKLQNAQVAVRISANETNADRTGQIAVKESKGLIKSVIIEIEQEYILVNRPGMVQFSDKAFKTAVLPVADTDHDGDISPEEAMAVTELNLKEKGIKNIEGLDSFTSLRKLDLSNNDLTDLNLSNPGAYANLRELDITGNPGLPEKINISGCYAGLGDNLIRNGDVSCITDAPSYYASKDYSYNGRQQKYGHTKGKGIILFFTTTQYLDVDYASGAVDNIIDHEIDELFSVEPFRSHKEYFDIYHLACVAPDTETKGEYSVVEQMRSTRTEGNYFVEIRVNSGKDRANAKMYDTMVQNTYVNLTRTRVAFMPEDCMTYRHVLTHEMGHALGRLQDQYAEDGRDFTVYKETPNFTLDKDNVPWQKFLETEKYKNRVHVIGKNGGFYPSKNSIMGNHAEEDMYENTRIFDSPSRFALYYNIIQLSDDGSSWPGKEKVWQNFLEYDKVNDNLPI